MWPKKNIIFVCLVCGFFIIYSCNRKIKNDIIIKGFIKNCLSKKLYLANASQWGEFIDSFELNGNKFNISLNNLKYKAPYLTSICYYDSSNNLKTLYFQNDVLSKGKEKFATNFFLLEDGIEINGDVNYPNEKFLTLVHGKANDAVFMVQNTDFGFLNSNEKFKSLSLFKNLIKRFPDSYYYLFCIENNKQLYSNLELTDILNCFTNKLKNSEYAKKILAYQLVRPNLDIAFPDISLRNAEGNVAKVLNKSSRINLLVFWASWCSPCKLEMPILKDLKNKYKTSDLNITSISIDQDTNIWKTSIEKERMDWSQLIVDSTSFKSMKENFDLSSIPLVIFTNKEGKELKRFNGFDKNDSLIWNNYISTYLKK